MGVQADTATADPGVLVGGGDGFTAGDAQQGIPPTQVSATFLNSVCDEINVVIRDVGDNDLGFGTVTFGGPAQLADAILRRMSFQRGWELSNPIWSRRTSIASGVERNWRTWFRNSALVNCSNNTVQTNGHLALPDGSVFWATFEVNVVKTDDITSFRAVILRAHCRRSGGTVTIGTVATVDDEGALGATFTLVSALLSGEAAVAVQTTLPAVGGASYNIAVSGKASNVTTGLV